MAAFDPRASKDEADAVLEEAAQRLRQLLHQAVRHLEPFPPYPGAFFTYAIEVEAPGAESPERGCIVLAPDGELYELQIGQEPPLLPDIADPLAMRREELKPLDNLHPRDYILYAYNALVKVLELLLEQGAEKG